MQVCSCWSYFYTHPWSFTHPTKRPTWWRFWIGHFLSCTTKSSNENGVSNWTSDTDEKRSHASLFCVIRCKVAGTSNCCFFLNAANFAFAEAAPPKKAQICPCSATSLSKKSHSYIRWNVLLSLPSHLKDKTIDRKVSLVSRCVPRAVCVCSIYSVRHAGVKLDDCLSGVNSN